MSFTYSRPAVLMTFSAVALLTLVGCSSSIDRQAAAESVVSTEPSSISSTENSVVASPQAKESAVPSTAEAPDVPRTTSQAVGHAMTVFFRPGPASAPVFSYEVQVAPRDALPVDSGDIETCLANGTAVTPCELGPLKSGNWDIWVRSVGEDPDLNLRSDWYLGASASVNSCTQADGVNGLCEKFDKGPGGGIVFYDAGSRESWGRYLEAAPAEWISGSGDSPSLALCQGGRIDKDGWYGLGTSASIGSGLSNTQKIASACGPESAASVAQTYAGGGLNDWYLPSKDELNEMYVHRNEIRMVNKVAYWTSTQAEGLKSTSAWSQTFATKNGTSDGAQLRNPINFGFPIRPIRAF